MEIKKDSIYEPEFLRHLPKLSSAGLRTTTFEVKKGQMLVPNLTKKGLDIYNAVVDDFNIDEILKSLVAKTIINIMELEHLYTAGLDDPEQRLGREVTYKPVRDSFGKVCRNEVTGELLNEVTILYKSPSNEDSLVKIQKLILDQLKLIFLTTKFISEKDEIANAMSLLSGYNIKFDANLQAILLDENKKKITDSLAGNELQRQRKVVDGRKIFIKTETEKRNI